VAAEGEDRLGLQQQGVDAVVRQLGDAVDERLERQAVVRQERLDEVVAGVRAAEV
jgi:hypothetical protein